MVMHPFPPRVHDEAFRRALTAEREAALAQGVSPEPAIAAVPGWVLGLREAPPRERVCHAQ